MHFQDGERDDLLACTGRNAFFDGAARAAGDRQKEDCLDPVERGVPTAPMKANWFMLG